MQEYTEVKISLKWRPPEKQLEVFPNSSSWPEVISTQIVDSNLLDFSKVNIFLGWHSRDACFMLGGMDGIGLRSSW